MEKTELPTPVAGLGASDETASTASEHAVREHLSALLADAEFQSSARRRQILTYIVEQTLDGNGPRLKGFELAVAVLGRDEHFDPQTNTIIRVEVSKLRKELEAYYKTSPVQHPIRIEIPRGRYIPTFHVMPRLAEDLPPTDAPLPSPAPLAPAIVPATPAHPMRRRAIFLGAALAVVLCAVLTVTLLRRPSAEVTQVAGPIVIIADFKASDEAGSPIATGLTNALVTDLTRFDGLQVFFGRTIEQWDQNSSARLAGVPVFMVTGHVDRGTTHIRTSVRLMDYPSGRIIWSRSFLRPLDAAAMLDVQDEMTADIASQLGQTYGLISHDTGKQIARGRPTNLFAYECVQKAFSYRLTFESTLYPPMRACLEEATRQDPGYADAWTMLAFAHLDAVRLHRVTSGQIQAEMDAALIAAQKGVELGPERVRPLQALAAVQFMRGDFAEAERVQKRAIALNPNNSESFAQLGWRHAVRSRPEEAISLLQQAIQHSLTTPTWYHTTLAVAYLDSNALDLAHAEAQQGKGFCCGLGKAVLAVIAAEKGQMDEAKTMLEAAIAEEPMIARDPTAFWSSWKVNDALITRLNAGLTTAGGTRLDEHPSHVEVRH